MHKMTMKVLAMAALTLAAASVAQAQERSWQSRQAEDGVFLSYGAPDSDDTILAFSCRLPGRRFRVSYEGAATPVRPGREVSVEFASEAGRVTLRMRGEPNEMGANLLSARPNFTQALRRLLAEGSTLRVTVAGQTNRIPLAGAQPGVAALATACSPR